MSTTRIEGTVVFASRRPKPRAVVTYGGKYFTVNFTGSVILSKGQTVSVEGTFRTDEDGGQMAVLDEARLVK
jgi:hypothetical protein